VSPLKIVFFGSDPIALPLLAWLGGAGKSVGAVEAVFTQPDRPVGRGQKVTPNAIKVWAQAHDLPVYQPEKLTTDTQRTLAALRADVALVMAYGHILKQDFIDTPRLGTLNLHTSLLPHYRGASPIQTAIAAGESVTGVTLMRIVRELDAGPVVAVERVAIDALDTALTVETKLAAACVPLLAQHLPELAAERVVFHEQAHSQATYCRRLTKGDGVLDFSAPATVLAARVNGLFPWPACTITLQGQPVKLGLADVMAGSAAPGVVLGSDSAGLLIGTGRDLLRLRNLQRPGGRMLSAIDFMRGWPIEPGTVVPSQPMPTLVSTTPFRR